MKTHLYILISFIMLFVAGSCKNPNGGIAATASIKEPAVYTDGFDFPVGKPDMNGYYNAQPFGKNNHLGDDLNGVGGGNTDLGDPVYATANGEVIFAEDIRGGWGNVIIIVHTFPDGKQVESLYGHCDEIFVNEGDVVMKGQKIGTIGNAHGIYWAHLHFEIRDSLGMGVGGGYSSVRKGYVDPTEFIKANR